jgi:hypothetical protein
MTAPGWVSHTLGFIAAAAVAAGIAALSRAPYQPYAGDAAMIRLAWSARPERIERCRRQSDEELEKLPAHMRQRVVCEGASARYQLEVRNGDTALLVDTLRGSGLRHDRSLYLLREIPISPGAVRLSVRFVRIDHPTPASESEEKEEEHQRESGRALPSEREHREDEERERRREEAVPALLVLDSTFQLDPRQVLLVTYDSRRRTLIGVTRAASPSP